MIEAAAIVALAGMPVHRFLRLRDNFERNVWLKIAERVFQLQNDLDENRARMIANAVGKMLSG